MNFRKLLGSGTVLAGLTVLGLTGMARPALATDPTDTTTTFTVGTTVVASCSISVSDATLPDYIGNASSDTTGSGAITYTCTPGASATVQLDGGTNGSLAQREMSDGNSHTLDYSIVTTSGGSTEWGDGTTGSTVSAPDSDGTQQTLTYYVDVRSGQFVTPNYYSDTITAEIDY